MWQKMSQASSVLFSFSSLEEQKSSHTSTIHDFAWKKLPKQNKKKGYNII